MGTVEHKNTYILTVVRIRHLASPSMKLTGQTTVYWGESLFLGTRLSSASEKLKTEDVVVQHMFETAVACCGDFV